MAKDNTDLSTQDAYGLLWKVNFTFIDKNDFIRNKSIVLSSPNAVDCQKTAETKLQTYKHARIVAIKPY